jgi:hypothetical protein
MVCTVNFWHVFLMYLDVQMQMCCLMFLVLVYTQFIVLLRPDAEPCWGQNWSHLNKHFHKSVLVVTRFLDICL